MSGGHQLQLAALWPWLLMATLQAGFGRTGLVLAAAVESEKSTEQKAIIRVIPLKMDPTGKLNLTLEGVFAGVAEITPAEGKLMQSHPLYLCNASDDDNLEPGFISIVKLESPRRAPRPCLSLASKARMAGERGASAVLFDITEDRAAAEQLQQPLGLTWPVVLIWGNDAEKLMEFVYKNRKAHVRIELKEPPTWPDYDVWILLTVVGTIFVIILASVLRIRCRPHHSRPDPLQQRTAWAISQLATRRYQASCRRARTEWPDSGSSCSSAPVCAICLEEFSEGQELRVISCLHEFHRTCVDPWLHQHQTCPLCMFNIVGRSWAKDSRVCRETGVEHGFSLERVSAVTLRTELPPQSFQLPEEDLHLEGTQPSVTSRPRPGLSVPRREAQVSSHVHYHRHRHHHYKKRFQWHGRKPGSETGVSQCRPVASRTQPQMEPPFPNQQAIKSNPAAPLGQFPNPQRSRAPTEPAPGRAEAASPSPSPSSHLQKSSLPIRHIQRKRRGGPSEPTPASGTQDLTVHPACQMFPHHSPGLAYPWPPEAHPLIFRPSGLERLLPETPGPCYSSSQPVWLCLTPRQPLEQHPPGEGPSEWSSDIPEGRPCPYPHCQVLPAQPGSEQELEELCEQAV
nr:E3 ubiquitin-protein ligase RNF43 [Cavia porcellus]